MSQKSDAKEEEQLQVPEEQVTRHCSPRLMAVTRLKNVGCGVSWAWLRSLKLTVNSVNTP